MAANPLERLIHGLARLPGIGEKSATRLAFFLLRDQKNLCADLAQALGELKEKMRLCGLCCTVSETAVCGTCQDHRRDQATLCVLEEPSDVVALERGSYYKGLYHVLHGALSPLDGVGPDDLKIKELLARLESSAVREVILATNPNVEGDATALYLTKLLKPLGLKISRLATGVPVGSELEYLDPSTLVRALEERREV